LRKEPIELLAEKFNQQVEQEGYDCGEEKATEIIGLLIERVTFFSDFWNQGRFLFVRPNEYDEQMARKKWNKEVADVLASFSDKLTDSIVESTDDTKQMLWQVANEQGLGIGKVMPGLRLAMTGSSEGPDLMGTIKVLGVEEVRERIQQAIEALN
jgi:glutamyl-tRNA synthetase